MLNYNKKKFLIIIVIIICLISAILLKRKLAKNNSIEKISLNQVIQVPEKEENMIFEDKIKIHISGQVNNPGLIELDIGSRIDDAIALAGGLTDTADVSRINLAYILSDGEKIYIPDINDEEKQEIENQTQNKKININLANTSELQTIPGVGESIANAIIEYRTKNRKIYVN